MIGGLKDFVNLDFLLKGSVKLSFMRHYDCVKAFKAMKGSLTARRILLFLKRFRHHFILKYERIITLTNSSQERS